MAQIFASFLGILTFAAQAEITNIDYLKPEDQKYFKNDIMEGNNTIDRVGMNVAEINKLHGEIATLKLEIARMKEEITELKKQK